MSTVHLVPAQHQALDEQSSRPENMRRVFVVGALVTAFVLAVNVFWFSLDKRIPSTDEAGHILNGLQYKELFQHFRPWRLAWLQQFLSINPFYPPAVYIYDGALKFLFGNGRWVDNLCFLSYVGLFTASTYGVAWRVSRCVGVASIATLLVSLYPQVAKLSHVYMLDMPLAAVVVAGLFSLMWWQSNPSWQRTLVTGAVVTLACFTKQLGAAFLIPPCLYLLLVVPPTAKVRLLAIAAMVSSVMLPWLLVNIKWIRSYAAENAQVMSGAQPAPVAVFGDYFVGVAYSMSFALTAAFALALLMLPKDVHKKLVMPYIFAVGGIALTSLLSCTFALDRYAAPVLAVTAIVTACGAREIYRRNHQLGYAFIATTLAIGTAQFISFSFSPYPVKAAWLTNISTAMGVSLREFRGETIARSTPMDAAAWGQTWAVDVIARRDPNAAVWLNILPSHGFYNPHSFELLAREIGSPLKPTTSRRWTIVGDQVEFSPTTAMYYHWYLLKTGQQGNKFQDAASESAYSNLIQFVTASGKFEHVADRSLPDGSTLSLYRQF